MSRFSKDKFLSITVFFELKYYEELWNFEVFVISFVIINVTVKYLF